MRLRDTQAQMRTKLFNSMVKHIVNKFEQKNLSGAVKQKAAERILKLVGQVRYDMSRLAKATKTDKSWRDAHRVRKHVQPKVQEVSA